MKSYNYKIIWLGISILIVMTFVSGFAKFLSYKKATFYINSKAVCQTFGINKNQCKVKVDYIGTDKGFYEVKYIKNGKVYSAEINKNIVELIKFPTK